MTSTKRNYSVFDHLAVPFNWREQNALDKSVPACDAYSSSYRSFFYEGGGCADIDIVHARTIKNDNTYRVPVEALLLSGATMEECATVAGVNIRAIEYYKKLFFDVDTKFSLIEKRKAVSEESLPAYREIKKIGVVKGKYDLMVKLGMRVDVPETEIRRLFMRALYSLVSHAEDINYINTPTQYKLSLEAMKLYMSYEKEVGREDVPEKIKAIMEQLSNSLKDASRQLPYKRTLTDLV